MCSTLAMYVVEIEFFHTRSLMPGSPVGRTPEMPSSLPILPAQCEFLASLKHRRWGKSSLFKNAQCLSQYLTETIFSSNLKDSD